MKLLFQLLIFLMPTQLALHFWPEWAHVFGIRVDYLSPTLYFTDILLVSLLGIWLFKSKGTLKVTRAISLLALVLINTALAVSPEVALLKWLKVGELALFIIFVVRTKETMCWAIKPLTYSLFFFAALGIVQFFLGRTTGFLSFLGERSFNTGTPGIALAYLFNQSYLRAYSTFGHPNAFAGFLVVGCAVHYYLTRKVNKFLYIFLGLGLLLSASHGAALSLLIVAIFYFTNPLKTKLKYILLAIIVISIALPYLVGRGELRNLPESLARRFSLTESAGKMVSESPVFGLGLNNFITSLPGHSTNTEVTWWLQPVHNIFLLILVETGIVGLFLFGHLIQLVSENIQKKKLHPLALALVFVFLTGFVDHYWATLQQNLLLFSFVLGLSLRKS